MYPDLLKLDELLVELSAYQATLVAVSKTRPVADIQLVYRNGQLDFGENYVQELVAKQPLLAADIHWHFIGHLQSNKVKLISPFVNLIHGVDSVPLALEVNRQAIKAERIIDILLQVHIASEASKFGLMPDETKSFLDELMIHPLPGIRIRGLMGMASFTADTTLIRNEFKYLKKLFETVKLNSTDTMKFSFDTLSMGMSSDYKIALDEGSTMVRIGSAIFGERTASAVNI